LAQCRAERFRELAEIGDGRAAVNDVALAVVDELAGVAGGAGKADCGLLVRNPVDALIG